MTADSNKHSYVKRINNISQVWDALESCNTKGLHIYNENNRSFDFMSYKEIYRESGYYAHLLKQYGISKGCKVLINSRTSKEFPCLWLALIRLGAVPACFPPREILMGRNTYGQRLRKIIACFDYYLCNENEVSFVKNVKKTKSVSIKIILKPDLLNSVNTNKHIIPEPVCLSENDFIFIQFSSGSTGTPKGICITYKNLFTNIYDIWTQLKFDPSKDIGVTWLPLYHDMGLVGYFIDFLFFQTNHVMISPQTFIKKPQHFIKLLSDYKAQMCSIPASAMILILRRFNESMDNNLSLKSLKWMGIGAEPINIHLLQEFEKKLKQYGLRDGVVSPCYGLAEATLAVSLHKPYQKYGIKKINNQHFPTVGKPLVSVKIKIESPDKEGIGIIKIKGDSVAKYALINGKTTNILDPEGFYATNDMGCFVSDELIILGRADDMFIYNGENFFPYEIEKIIQNMKQKTIKRVVCFTIPDTENKKINPYIIILYESKKITGKEQQKMETAIRQQVAGYIGLQVSKIQMLMPMSIPITSSGKIQRKKTKELYQNRAFKEITNE